MEDDDLLGAVAEILGAVARVRVFDRSGPALEARKRRDRRPALAEIRDAEALADLRRAMRLRLDTRGIALMQWPDLWLHLLGDDNRSLVVVGVLRPDWLRWKPYGDIGLKDPTAFESWLRRWAPDAAP